VLDNNNNDDEEGDGNDDDDYDEQQQQQNAAKNGDDKKKKKKRRENNNNHNDAGGFNPEHLICPRCTPNGEKQTCAVHGSSFMLFKCKFCCNVAAFFCWGTTHFCASCHHIQEGGRYLNKLPISDLPVCKGPGRCPLGGNHPANGTAEFALGCALCK
jgi:hypothetical protein